MPADGRLYPYVGPAELRELGCEPQGVAITSPEPFTFTVSVGGDLLFAPRRSEHVHCAGGREILAAEITFTQDGPAWRAVAVTNHSTGYCPAPESWPAAADALDRAGIARPPGYDPVVVFHRCPACQALNIVRDGHFACALCDEPLSQEWNIAQVQF